MNNDKLEIMKSLHGFKVGDWITLPIPLTRWERFKRWLFGIEPKPREFVVTRVTSSEMNVSEVKK